MSHCAAFLLLSLLAGAEARPLPDRHGDPLPDGAIARLGTTRQRVAASRIALSRNGRTIITVAGGRMIGRWDAATGRLRGFRRLPGVPVDEAWLSPYGRLLAVGEGGENLAIFDTETGDRKRLLVKPGRPYAFAPDGTILVIRENVAAGRRIRLWNLATGEGRLLVELTESAEFLSDCAFSSDGKRLFAVVGDNSLRCWDLTGKEIWRANHSARRLMASPDGRTLCSHSDDQPDLQLWDANSGRPVGQVATGKQCWLDRAAFAPDGRTGFVVDHQNILLWDTATRAVRHRLTGAGYRYAVSSDSKTIVSLSGSQLRRWDVASGEPLYPDTAGDGHTCIVCGLVFTPDGQGIITIGDDQTIRLWDLATQRPRTFLTGVCPRSHVHPSYRDDRARASPDSWRATCIPRQNLAITADGRHLLHSSERGYLCLTDIRTGEEDRRFDVGNTQNTPRLGAARLSADGRTLWTLPYRSPGNADAPRAREQKKMLIGWDVSTGQRLSAQDVSWCGHSGEIIVAPDGRSVVPEFGSLRDVASGEERLKEEQGLSHPVAFSADSRLVASADLRGENRWDTIAVHELLTGRRLIRLEAPISWSSRFAFSPDGRLLVVSGDDALHVWEVSTGRRLLHLSAEGRLPAWLPGSFGICLAVAPDGRSAATGHEDGTVLLWDLAPAWLRLAERSVAAPTAAELDGCWADLLKDDPRTAYRAMDRLIAASRQALSLLRKHLKPVTVESHWLAERLVALDSPDFAVREKASRDLEGVAEVVEPRLRREMERTASAEVRGRLRRILEVPRPLVPPGEIVRQLRAVAVLERLASAETRALLRELAKGEPAARLTIAAGEALSRLAAADARRKPAR